MIRIQLWRDERLLQEDMTESSTVAERRIDELITEAHAKKYGPGRFTIEADHIHDRRHVFLGSFFRNDRILVGADGKA